MICFFYYLHLHQTEGMFFLPKVSIWPETRITCFGKLVLKWCRYTVFVKTTAKKLWRCVRNWTERREQICEELQYLLKIIALITAATAPCLRDTRNICDIPLHQTEQVISIPVLLTVLLQTWSEHSMKKEDNATKFCQAVLLFQATFVTTFVL